MQIKVKPKINPIIKIFTIYLIFFPLNSFALNVNYIVGVSVFYNDINDPNFNYTDKWNPIKNISSINTGLSINQDNFAVGVTTNRAFNKAVDREVKNKKSRIEYNNKTKVYADSLFVGYQLNKWQPSLFVTNANVKKSLYKNDILLNRTQQSSILWGINLGYFITRHIQTTFTYVMPNREQYLESGLSVGFSYIF